MLEEFLKDKTKLLVAKIRIELDKTDYLVRIIENNYNTIFPKGLSKKSKPRLEKLEQTYQELVYGLNIVFTLTMQPNLGSGCYPPGDPNKLIEVKLGLIKVTNKNNVVNNNLISKYTCYPTEKGHKIVNEYRKTQGLPSIEELQKLQKEIDSKYEDKLKNK